MAKPKGLVYRRYRQTFEAYHWHVVHDIDGHDPEAVKKAILEAGRKDKPSLIICRTVGFGSPNKAGKEESRGIGAGRRGGADPPEAGMAAIRRLDPQKNLPRVGWP